MRLRLAPIASLSGYGDRGSLGGSLPDLQGDCVVEIHCTAAIPWMPTPSNLEKRRPTQGRKNDDRIVPLIAP